MIGIVEEHNLLSGHRFVILEYAAVALLLGLIGAWYVAAHRALDAAIWLGMSANCAVIALLAGASLRDGIRDFGTLPLRDSEFRRSVAREHPHLWRRTMILIAITFVPLLLAGLVLVETVRDAVAGPSS